eukprot:Partr_v1_DN28499_c2_g1_i1_m42122 putative tRNA selenocysteine 1 associated protein 1
MNFDLYASTLPSLRVAANSGPPVPPPPHLQPPHSSTSTPSPTPSSPAPVMSSCGSDHHPLHHHHFGGGMSGSNSSFGGGDQRDTLWMGDLDPWMDESFVKQVWMSFGEHVNVKMIRDKFSGMNAGYCFVEFSSADAALNALQNFNGCTMTGTCKSIRLNWASGGGINDKKDQGPEFSIFVGDLGPEVDDAMLFKIFNDRFPSCKTAKVVTDAMTNLSRGYGFVRFSDESEQQMSMAEMQGQFCGSRPMRISMATPKNRFGNVANWASFCGGNAFNNMANADPSNTTVFVGGLTNSFVSEEELASYFAPFGPITYVKIPSGKGCGFVSFVHRQSAEQAITHLNGCLIAGNRIRLSWGRNNGSSSGGSLSVPSSPTLSTSASVGGNPMMTNWRQPMSGNGSAAPGLHHHNLVVNSSPSSPTTASNPSPENLSLHTLSINSNSSSMDKPAFALTSPLSASSIFQGSRSLFGIDGATTPIDGESFASWKIDSPMEPMSRPSSAFSFATPFSQHNALVNGGSNFRSSVLQAYNPNSATSMNNSSVSSSPSSLSSAANGGASQATNGKIGFSSAPNSPTHGNTSN